MSLTARVKRVGQYFQSSANKARREEERREAEARAEEQQRLDKIARRRRKLLDGDPSLRSFTADGVEMLGRAVEDFTAAGASERNLNLVADALDKAGVEYFLVPGRSPLRHVVGVHRSQRKAFLEAMRELYRASAVYAAKPTRDGVTVFSAYVDGALDEQIKSGLTIRVAEHLLSPGGRVLAGFEHGCDVEFWRDGASVLERDDSETVLSRLRVQTPRDGLADALVAPRRNRIADVLPGSERTPATLSVGGREHPTFEAFTWKLVEEVDFPVDVVYTWVDGADPEHAAKRARHLGGDAEAARLAANESRFTSRDELLYSLRSLRMYAPFVRHVYLVTDDQVPAWLDPEAEGITVVDHRDIFADPDALPTFNSHAIESQLHHIEGLSEHYLYFNDDVFLARPVRAEDFFHANGIARLPFSPFQFGLGRPVEGEVAPNSAGKNVRPLFAEDFGRQIIHKFKHTPHPQIRGVLSELEDKYAEDVERTMRSRFRSLSDVGLTAIMHHHFALLTGRAVPAEFRLRYVDIGLPGLQEKLDLLDSSDEVDFFCLNDLDTAPEDQEAVADAMRTFLESRFPYPSRYEKAAG
ncbi:Stealth-like protein [Nocardiopsis sp. Huas11]|uniref:stealth family protein n=1 Tax=Nocardiopsis sp. Huas11 TaxID=2183912 RepID=UPI000EB0F282|nr:stealth family protein [Nocardiopsis sp. Huas11]RKS07573.1 Stealth-like protein [Nocardiopsis sp. Huas11]